ncbi:MAG: PQQ-dependent sugar dehydrogenase, partial [Acidimicrobiia bacterium]|nr:PQQ-dependent sugar dehydrogenase [Acidimicrobiia bacterium]
MKHVLITFAVAFSLTLLATACVADDQTAATFEAESTLPPVTADTDGGSEETTPPTTDAEESAESTAVSETTATTAPLPELQGLDVELIADGFDQPVTIAVDDTAVGDTAVGDTAAGTIYVSEREGIIKAVAADGSVEMVADLTDRIGSSSIEQGLLGLAFDDGDLYAYWTDPQGDSVLARFPDADTSAEPEVLLTVDQPAERHNAGHIVIDGGYLYLSLGDGGSGGNTAQDTSNPLGSILRLDLDGNPVPGNERDAIWVYGLRNPWRFSIDHPPSGPARMYIGDVGQEQYEEINVVELDGGAGTNFGWIEMEGDQCFRSGCEPEQYTLPVLQYSHTEGCSITGGHVYRGAAIPEFTGHYFYADWCKGWVRSMRYDPVTGTVADQFDWTDDLTELGQVTSFGV